MNTIKDIKKFPIGSTIPAVSGTVKIVWERELKKGQYGEFFSQGFVLADGDEEIVVSCMDFDDLKYLKGQVVSVAATGKDKRTGLPAGTKLKEYNGKLSIGVSKKSGGFVGGDTPNPAHMAGGTPAAASQTAIPAIPSHSAPPAVSGGSFDERMAKMATLYKHCLFYAGTALNGSKLTDPESLRNVATSLFIEANKSGMGANPPAFLNSAEIQEIPY